MLQDIVTCIREHVTIDKAGRLLDANAERHLKPPQEMARLFRASSGRASRRRSAFSTAAHFSLDELRAPNIRTRTAPGLRDAAGRADRAGRRRACSGAIRTACAECARRARPGTRRSPASSTTRRTSSPSTTSSASRAPKGILCQGRGSAANSVICYCLGITEVDPDNVDLLFERFVSAERREPPDIDVDFEHERREEVIQYIYEKYGRDHAGLTATVICYRGRSAIREVGKVFGLSDDTIGALAGTLWGWSMDGVADKEARRAGLDPSDPRLQQVDGAGAGTDGISRAISRSMSAASSSRARGSTRSCRSRMPRWRTAPSSNGTRTISKRLGLLRSMCWASACCRCLRRAFDLLRSALRRSRTILPRFQDEEPADLPDDAARRHDRRVPDRKPRADVDAAAAAAEGILRPRDRGRDRAAGPDPGQDGASLSAAARGAARSRHRAGLSVAVAGPWPAGRTEGRC